MIDAEALGTAMTGDNCRAEPFTERYRDALRAACAEDREIWEIYANNFGPDGFDDSIQRYVSNPNNLTFVLFEGDELAGMLHYNFPPYSVGEVGRFGAPGRREVGHGKLAWRALHAMPS